jgi:predicted ATPase
VHVRGQPPEADYRFKHALVRDAAYESLLRSRRQVLHRRVAETLRDRFPARADAEPEVAAHHFTHAGLAEPASDWWGRAGEQAMRRSAIAEAIAHFEKAIELADTLPDAPERRLSRLRTQIAYGNLLIAAHGHGAKETAAAFARARKLTAGIEDAAERLSIHWGLWAGAYFRGELAPAREMAAAFLRDIADRPESGEAGVAHRAFALTCWFAGEFAEAREHHERALSLIDPAWVRALTFSFGQDPGVTASSNLALTLWPLGHVDLAVRHSDDAAARASASGHLHTLGFAMHRRLLLDMMRARHDLVLPIAGALVDLSSKHDMRYLHACGAFSQGWARRRADECKAGLEAMQHAIAVLRDQGVGLFLPFLATLLAEAQGEAGEVERALACIDETIAEIERGGQRWCEAESYRVRGLLC